MFLFIPKKNFFVKIKMEIIVNVVCNRLNDPFESFLSSVLYDNKFFLI